MVIKEYNALTGVIEDKVIEDEVIDEIDEVPCIITSRQLRLVMLLKGIDNDSIINIISRLPEEYRELARVNWEYAVTFDRYNPMLLNIASLLNLTSDDLDDLFKEGSKL